LVCVEGPEVRFEDVLSFKLEDLSPTHEDVCKTTGAVVTHYKLAIDPVFYEVCAKQSIDVASILTSHPCIVGGHAVKQDIMLHLIKVADTPLNELSVVIKLTGLRAGQEDIRFPQYTEEEYRSNQQFWNQATKIPADGEDAVNL
jgi:hypothetical protein